MTGSTVGDEVAVTEQQVPGNDPVATPAEQRAAPVEGQLNDQMEAANTAGDLPPDGGNVIVAEPDTP